MLDLWYKNAVVYCLDVDTYMDGNGDGIGDFAGLSSRLNYLAGIGVTCIWLLPFYPTPDRDNGYDIVDFYNVAPTLGTLGDFVDFTHQAEERGIRVIVDLVVNHTSIEHPWFQEARRDPNSKYRDFYVWSKTKPKDADTGMVFPGVQTSTWTYDKEAKAYFFHRFYDYQPDLNIANPAVREEIQKIMGFWLQLGVSGFRMDAAPFVIELKGIEDVKGVDPYQYLNDMHHFLSWRKAGAMMLAEANLEPNLVTAYFGDGERFPMLFNFWVNQRVFLALATENAEPIQKAMQQLPEIAPRCQWANFLRNHDEIDLGRLTDDERAAVIADMGPEPSMQLYDRGIRRRLAPMLGSDSRRLEMAYSLLFSLPGTPVIWYGEEIGMGDDLSLPERNSVRTPMQWADEENGGFSTAPPAKLKRPIVSEGAMSFKHVNVASQRRDPKSLLNVIERMIRTRKESPEIGWGEWSFLDSGAPSVLAHCCRWRGQILLALHNLSREPAVASLDLTEYACDHLIDMLDDQEPAPVEAGCFEARLPGYGYRWYRIPARSAVPAERSKQEAAGITANAMPSGDETSTTKAVSSSRGSAARSTAARRGRRKQPATARH
ncbi:MAG: alpha-amylase family protein [Chloroflexota bacterium]